MHVQILDWLLVQTLVTLMHKYYWTQIQKNILILILGSYRAPLVLVMHVQILLTLKIKIHKTYWTPLKTWSMGHTYTNTTEELLQIPHWLHVQIHKHIATNTQNILLLRSGSYRTPFCPGPWSGMYKFLWYICTNTENMLNLGLVSYQIP